MRSLKKTCTSGDRCDTIWVRNSVSLQDTFSLISLPMWPQFHTSTQRARNKNDHQWLYVWCDLILLRYWINLHEISHKRTNRLKWSHAIFVQQLFACCWGLGRQEAHLIAICQNHLGKANSIVGTRYICFGTTSCKSQFGFFSTCCSSCKNLEKGNWEMCDFAWSKTCLPLQVWIFCWQNFFEMFFWNHLA